MYFGITRGRYGSGSMKRLLIVAIILLLLPYVNADTKYKVTGYVYDVSNRELTDAVVQITSVKLTNIIFLKVIVYDNYDIEVYIDNVRINISYEVGVKIRIFFSYDGYNFRLIINKRIGILMLRICKVESYVIETENGSYEIELDEGKYYFYVTKENYTSYLDYVEVKSDLILTHYLMSLEEYTRLEYKVCLLENRVENIEDDIRAIWDEINVMKSDLNVARQRIDEIENRLSVVEQELIDIRAEIGRIENEFASKIKLLENEIDEIKKEIVNMWIEIAKQQLEINELNIRLGLIENRLYIPEEIPRYRLGVRVYCRENDVYYPLSGQYIWVIGAYEVPKGKYTDENGTVVFENCIGDVIRVRYGLLDYQFRLDRDDWVRIVYDNGVSYVAGDVVVIFHYDNVARVYIDNRCKEGIREFIFSLVPVGEHRLLILWDDKKIEKMFVNDHRDMIIEVSPEGAVNIKLVGAFVAFLGVTSIIAIGMARAHAIGGR